MAAASTEGLAREGSGVAAPAPAVELGCCGADGDEVNVDVEVAVDAGHVAE